jgi:hypothetical protein
MMLLPSPDEHQPLHGGPASFLPPGTTQLQLWRMPNRPARATKQTRATTLSLLQGLGQPWVAGALAPGHDQADFDPQHGVANLRTGAAANIVVQRRARQQQQQQNNALVVPGLKLLVIGANECFARAAFHFLVQLEVDLHLHPTRARQPLGLALEATLQLQMGLYRNPAVAPFAIRPLINDLNHLMPPNPAQQFAVGGVACAMEFVSEVLRHVLWDPAHIVTYLQQGTCNLCGQAFQAVSC